MPLNIYLGSDLLGQKHQLKHSHEVEGFRKICDHLWEKFHHQENHYAIIANVRRTISGREVTPDVVLISELGLGVLELKHSYGVIDCGNPDGTWRAGPSRIKPFLDANNNEEGSQYLNPHKQIQDYGRQVRDDLIKHVIQDWFSIDPQKLDDLILNTAVCFTNPEVILAGCKEAIRIHYRFGEALAEWEKFSVLTPAEISGWALGLRFDLNFGPANFYHTLKLSANDLFRLATEFFGGVEWSEMIEEMYRGRKPYGYLELIVNDDPEQIYRLDHDEVIIGRDQDRCHVVVSSAYRDVSRQHARIIQTKNDILLEDLNSKFGTFIDGVQIQGRKSLIEKDLIITLGGAQASQTVCQVRFSKTPPSPPPTGIQR